MSDIFKNGENENPEDNGVVVLSRTKPYECGGTDAMLDKNAPKQIESEDMVLFDATCSFCGVFIPESESVIEKIGYISAFAAPVAEGSLVLLIKRSGFSDGDETTRAFAPVKENVFPALVKLVRDCNLAKSNGFHSETHGLPGNFGGRVNILYASGEKISFSNNQSPVISPVVGQKISDIFTPALKGEKIILPDVSELKEIIFYEERENGGFTKAELTLNPDGTGTNKKTSRYDNPTVYESEKPVTAQTVDLIKQTIAANCMFIWQDLPESEFTPFGNPKTITFRFYDRPDITVTNNKALPFAISNAFFNLELELTVKN